MKKRVILLSILILLATGLFAADANTLSVGVEGGYTLGFFSSYGDYAGLVNSPGHGFNAAISGEYHILDWLSVSSGILYEMRSYRSKMGAVISGRYDEGYDIINDNHYLDIPLTLRFSFASGSARIFIGGGAYIGARFLYHQSGTSARASDGQSAPFSENVDLAATRANIFDAGIIAEVGAGFEVAENSVIYFVARYKRSLTALDETYQRNQTTRYIDALSLSLGYTYSFAL